jgi:hypothetical protein
MIAWPATLPQEALSDGYQSGFGDGRARTETDSGIAKVRRRFSAVPRPLTFSMHMTNEQLAIFKTFVTTDTAGGVKPFTFPAQDEPGTWIVQFGRDLPRWAPRGLDWIVSFDLVILP